MYVERFWCVLPVTQEGYSNLSDKAESVVPAAPAALLLYLAFYFALFVVGGSPLSAQKEICFHTHTTRTKLRSIFLPPNAKEYPPR